MDGRKEPVSEDGDIEGLDDSQRAEVHAYEGGGPSDGDVLTDLTRDRGEDYVEDDRRSELAPNAPEDAAMSGDEYEEVGEQDDEDDA
jgi:hypothetical protein